MKKITAKLKTKLRGLSGMWEKLVPTFADKECHVVIVTDPYGRILGFLDRNPYFSSK
jgi:CBS-domain-containing membrane protein